MPLARWSAKKAWELVKNNREYTEDNPLVIMELCAGPAPFAQAASEFFTKIGIPHVIHALEINPAFPRPVCVDHWWVRDATKALPVKVDVVLMNPPFALAEAILRRAIEALRPNGHVVALLPAHFEFSKGRDGFLEKHYYKDRIVLSRRPGFYYALINQNERYGKVLKDGTIKAPSGKGTDHMHYCMFVWDDKERQAEDRLFWEYDDDDALHRSMQESNGMAVYALIYEAAKAEEGELVFDDLWSMMSARVLGWKFIDAAPEQRLGMRLMVKEKAKDLGLEIAGDDNG